MQLGRTLGYGKKEELICGITNQKNMRRDWKSHRLFLLSSKCSIVVVRTYSSPSSLLPFPARIAVRIKTDTSLEELVSLCRDAL